MIHSITSRLATKMLTISKHLEYSNVFFVQILPFSQQMHWAPMQSKDSKLNEQVSLLLLNFFLSFQNVMCVCIKTAYRFAI